MADKLLKLIILVLFISFQTVSSDEGLNPKEVNVEDNQDVKEEPEDNQASAAETAESEESKGSPGFLSQVFSELAAPLYEEDENDFLSEDSPSVDPSPEENTGEEGNKNGKDSPSENPSSEDDIREKDKNKDNDDSPSVDPSTEDNNQEEDDNMNNEEPQFASSKYMSSVTEDSNSRPTVDQQTDPGGHEEKPIWPDVAAVPAKSESTSDTADSNNEHDPPSSEDHEGNGNSSIAEELSEDDDANALNNKDPEMEAPAEDRLKEKDREDTRVELDRQEVEGIESKPQIDLTVQKEQVEEQDKEHKVDKGAKRTLPEQEGRNLGEAKLHVDRQQAEIDRNARMEEEKNQKAKNIENLKLKLNSLRKQRVEIVEHEKMAAQQQNKEEEEDQQQRLKTRTKQQQETDQSEKVSYEKKHEVEKDRQLKQESLRKQAEIGKHENMVEQQKSKNEKDQEQSRETRTKQQDTEQSEKMSDEKKYKNEKDQQLNQEPLRKQQQEIRQPEKMVADDQEHKDEEGLRTKKQEEEIEQSEKMSDDKNRKDEEDRQLRLESLRKQLAEIEQHGNITEEQKHKEEKDQQQRLETMKKQKEENEHHEKMAAERTHEEKKEKEDHKQDYSDNGKEKTDKERKIDGQLDLQEKDLIKKIEDERKMLQQMAQEYRINKHGKQAKVQRESEHTMQRSAEESPKSLVKKQEVPAKVDQASIMLPASVTSIMDSWTPTPSIKKLAPTKTETSRPVASSTAKTTEHLVVATEEKIQPTATLEATFSATVSEATSSATASEATSSATAATGATSSAAATEATSSTTAMEATSSATATEATSSATATEATSSTTATEATLSATATKAVSSTTAATETMPVYPGGAEVSVASKVVLTETESVDNATRMSAYSTFMVSFRSFHERSFRAFLSYWPTIRNSTRDVLGYVGLDGSFEQLCDDLADVHPAILFGTFLFGTLGILYLLWSLTLGRIQQGAQGPNPRDVVRSKDARIRILEAELKAADDEKLALIHERDTAVKEKCIREEQLQDTDSKIERLQKEIKRLKKREEEVNEYVSKVTSSQAEAEAEVQEKGQRIKEYENMISELEIKIEAKQTEIGQLNEDIQEQQKERQANQQLIEELNSKIEQADVENKKLESMLQEAKDSKQSLQADFDEQLLRLTEMNQQYNFKRDECELLQDCLKQIKVNSADDEDKEDDEEPDPHEMEKRLEDLMDVAKAKAELKKSLETQRAMESELDEHRKTRKALENEVEEIREQLVQLKSKADHAALTQREKEIELEALQKYFKSSEVELHRKLTAEESARINTENQLQSEQAKASTAVVDADKYRQLYLDIKKQIEEIDQSKKEQLSNMEAKAHQNWLDYRAATNEVEALKEENDLLRRKLYDMEVRGSRPGSSASSGQMNHIDGRDSPRQSPMTGPPGHGSPVPFAPMMGPPLPPPPGMFPVQRRHPAEMLMTPPRPPFPPQGHATPPLTTSTPQTSKPDDRITQDGSPRLPPPPPPPMGGYGPRPMPPIMGMPRFPLPPPRLPPPVSGGQGPRIFRPGGPLPPPLQMQGPRPSS